MIRALSLVELAGRCRHAEPVEPVTFSSVTSDSRQLQKNDLFVALRGEHFDGHAFVEQVAQQGACAAVVEKKQPVALPQLVVDNTTHALGQLASLNRDQFRGPVIAVTGSSGKTTVKQMIAAILEHFTRHTGKVLATKGNLNNHIGVPQTLLEISSQHEYAIIEMGASALGEIAYLAKIAKPQVSVVNNVGTAHVGGFGSVDNIAKGKGEIYQFLPAHGTAVINRDDPYADQWIKQSAQCKQMTFSVKAEADVTAKNISRDNTGCFAFELVCLQGSTTIQLPLIGEHNIANALAAAACCLAVHVDLASIKRGLESVVNVAGRMQIKTGVQGSRVIDDSYNANPASMRAAIDALADMQGRRILILGDMAELGEQSESLHREIGTYAQQKNIDDLFSTGKSSACSAQAFGKKSQHFVSKSELIAACKKILDKNCVVLVKGSRSAGMEEVANGLLNEGFSAC